MRLADFGSLHRNENTVSLRGLTRVRCFHQDDAHIFCRPDQMQEEVAACLDFIDQIYSARFGLQELELQLVDGIERAFDTGQLYVPVHHPIRMDY